MTRRIAPLIAPLIALLAAAGTLGAQTTVPAPWMIWPASPERCTPTTGDAATVLRRARAAIGLGESPPPLLRMSSRSVVTHNYESDRTYRPFLTFVTDHLSWIDLAHGVTRDSSMAVFGADTVVTVLLANDTVAFARRDTAWRQSDDAWSSVQLWRALDPWLVLGAWSGADARVTARCLYRDYPRLVLTRSGVYGPERLYIDPKSWLPVKVDRMEPHYLWGQLHTEYVYATWQLFGDVRMPTVSTMLIDGDEQVVRSIATVSRVSRDSAPRLTVPDGGKRSVVKTPAFLRPAPLDTMRLGPRTFALTNPGYNEVVTLQHDTVFVLDATQSEARARADSAWVGRLFPGRHPVVLVVTDLAWPHVSGLRFWVASGATIMSRDMSRAFLQAIVSRRWTREPDKLESVHPRPSLAFIPVRDSLVRSGIRVYAIDGLASEGALMAFLPADSLLWASDYVQQLTQPALYTNEVFAAAHRVGIQPTRVIAQHQPLAPWSTLAALVGHSPGM
jgi:hypothetical protein